MRGFISKNHTVLCSVIFVVLGAVWGGSFVAIKSVIERVPAFTAATGRVAVGTLFLTVLFTFSRQSVSIPLRSAMRVWVCGLFSQGLPFAFLFWGERFISPGLAGLLNGTVPLWTFLLGFVFLRKLEVFTPARLAGVIVSIFGVALIFRPALSLSSDPQELAGLFAVFMMAVSYAIVTLSTRWVLATDRDVTFASNVYHQHLSSLVFLTILSIATEDLPSVQHWLADPVSVGCILYLGVFSTALGLYLYYYLIHLWGAVRASAVSYLIPMFSILWDYVFYRHLPTTDQLWGGLAIVGGLALIQLRDWSIALANRRAATGLSR